MKYIRRKGVITRRKDSRYSYKTRQYKRRNYARLAKTIRQVAGIECKYATYTFGPTIVGPGWYLFGTNNKGILGSVITQGTQNNQMVGNNLYVRKIMFELNVCFDETNVAPANINNPNNLEQWQYRVVMIKPYNTTDLLTNFNAPSNARLPGGLQALYTPIDFQTGKIVFDKIYNISPTITWAQNNGIPNDPTLPTERTHKMKFDIMKEYLCDPGSNIWQKDICFFIYTNQFNGATGAFKNISLKGGITVYFTDS